MEAAKTSLSVALLVFGMIASMPVMAWHHGGHARIGVYIGAPVYWYPRYYYPPYYSPYYPPVVVVPSAPPTYIERESAQAAPAQSNWWYYCADAKVYYPYVKECAAGWQQVAPQPQTLPGGKQP